MPRVGLILKVDQEKKQATISTSKRGVCENCGESASCSLESGSSNETSEVIVAHNDFGAREGDTVEFDLAGHAELKISLIVWAVPLAGIISGTFAGTWIKRLLSVSADTGTLLGAFFGFILAFSGVVIYDRLHQKSPDLTPHVIGIVHSSCVLPRSNNPKNLQGPMDV